MEGAEVDVDELLAGAVTDTELVEVEEVGVPKLSNKHILRKSRHEYIQLTCNSNADHHNVNITS